jgi:hypothetical protein
MDEEREREPFPTEDPRQKGVGDQLPEENPEGQGAGGGRERQGDDAPATSSDEDSNPDRATGNPNAAA